MVYIKLGEMEVRPKEDLAFQEKSVSGSGRRRTAWGDQQEAVAQLVRPLPVLEAWGGRGVGTSSPFLSCEPLLSE